jgi:hypothetical protein
MASITITDLNNAKLDVDHIAAIATSPAATAADRLGVVKNTIAGSLALIASDVADVEARKVQALAVDIPAAIASVAAINNLGAWVAGATYTAGYPSTTKDIASYYDATDNKTTWYICVVPHTASAAFATDVSKWRVYQAIYPS